MKIHDGHPAGPAQIIPQAYRPVTIGVRGAGQDLSGGHQGINVSYLMSSAENPVVQLLPRDYERLEARVLAYCPNATPNSGSTIGVLGKVTPVAAFASVANLNVAVSGQYSITVIVYVDGTVVTADDEDNMELVVNGTTISLLAYPGESSGVNPPLVSGPYIENVTAGASVIQVKVAGTTPSGTAVYHAQIIATPVSGSLSPAGIVLAQSKEMAEWAASAGTAYAGPIGSFLPLGVDRSMRHCDEIWAAALTTTPVLVSAIVSRRLDVEPPARP
jgi:hypothetical protein